MPIPPPSGPSVPNNINKSANSSRKGRKRKSDQQKVDTLKEKLEVVQRVQKLKTTQELVQSLKTPVSLSFDGLPSGSTVEESNSSNGSNPLTAVRQAKLKLSSDPSAGGKSQRGVPHNTSSVCDDSKSISVREFQVELDDDEKRTKDELMQRFLSSASASDDTQQLQTSHYDHNSFNSSLNRYKDRNRVTTDVPTNNNRLVLLSGDVNYSVNNIDSTVENSSLVNKVEIEIREILSKLPPLKPEDYSWTNYGDNNVEDEDENNDDGDKEEELHRNQDRESETINGPLSDHGDDTVKERTSDLNIVSTSTSVSEETLNRIESDKWECVNGTYNSKGEWREWQEMTDGHNPASGELLHILPYVNTTW